MALGGIFPGALATAPRLTTSFVPPESSIVGAYGTRTVHKPVQKPKLC